VTGFLGRVGIFRGPVAPIDVGQDHIKRCAAPSVKPDQRVDQFLRMREAIEIQSYLEAESLFNMAIASCTVVINCAGKIIVEFFSVAISAIVCSVRS
jgi:hypothetical protein